MVFKKSQGGTLSLHIFYIFIFIYIYDMCGGGGLLVHPRRSLTPLYRSAARNPLVAYIYIYIVYFYLFILFFFIIIINVFCVWSPGLIILINPRWAYWTLYTQTRVAIRLKFIYS